MTSSPVSNFKKTLNHFYSRGPRAVSSGIRAKIGTPRSSGHILLMHNGRSGSTLLGDILDQHSEIFWDGETIEKMLHRRAIKEGIGIDKIFNVYDGESAINEIKNRIEKRAGNRFFGTEIQDYHLNMIGMTLPDFTDRLKALGFTKFIFLDRNYMRKVVSHVVATEKNKFHVKSSTKTTKTSITINPEKIYIGHRFTSLLSVLEQYQSFSEEVSRLAMSGDLLHLVYEDDIQNDPEIAAEKCRDFLNISAHHYKVNFGKTTNIPLNELITNYDEIASIVKSSSFASHMIDTVC